MSDQDELFKDYDDDETLDKRTSQSFHKQPQRQRSIIRVHENNKKDQFQGFYDKNTFNWQIMFINVTQHQHSLSQERYDDTINNTIYRSQNSSLLSQKLSQNSNSFSGLSGLSNSSWSKSKKKRNHNENNSISNKKLNVLDELQKQSGSQNQAVDTKKNSSWQEWNNDESEDKKQPTQNILAQVLEEVNKLDLHQQIIQNCNPDQAQEQKEEIQQDNKQASRQSGSKQNKQDKQQPKKVQAQNQDINQNQTQKQFDQLGQLLIQDFPQDPQLQVMELNVSRIEKNEDFEKIMNMSFSHELSKSIQKKQQKNVSEEHSQQLNEQKIKQRLKQLQDHEKQRLIIRFKYENCRRITLKCIGHELSCKNQKPKKIKENNYLQINSTKFQTVKCNSDNELWEVGESKIPIQVVCVSMMCHLCRTASNIAYSRDQFFSTICRNQECMKPMSFEIVEISPK